MADTEKLCCGIALPTNPNYHHRVLYSIKEREKIMRQWQKYSKSKHEDIDKFMRVWFMTARYKNIPISGKMIQ